ncbi:MAG: hypothetical protein IKS78_03160, partial [Clostridia bacterium]|nr:hypothetical protein [Clostridia bacterium]
GYTAYQLSRFEQASDYFERSFNASATAPLSKLDTAILYNAGFSAWRAGDLDRAKQLFTRCLDYGYYATGGDVYVKLSDIARKQEDTKLSKDYLEAAFVKFPQSQGILVGLINYYLESNEDTGRLFELIGEAKENEPDNASLYYVEGNIYKQLGNRENAIASYRKCAETDAAYPYGFIGEGLLLYECAAKTLDEAVNEMNDAKYRALLEKANADLEAAVAPFESAFGILDDAQTKLGVAEYIKNICFRFRDKEGYQAKYEQYAAFVEANKE